MGVYDTIIAADGSMMQTKASRNPLCETYQVGDDIDHRDGIFLTKEGTYAVVDGVIVAAFPHLNDKWGDKIHKPWEALVQRPL